MYRDIYKAIIIMLLYLVLVGVYLNLFVMLYLAHLVVQNKQKFDKIVEAGRTQISKYNDLMSKIEKLTAMIAFIRDSFKSSTEPNAINGIFTLASRFMARPTSA
jgi:hypothetical protein